MVGDDAIYGGRDALLAITRRRSGDGVELVATGDLVALPWLTRGRRVLGAAALLWGTTCARVTPLRDPGERGSVRHDARARVTQE